MELELSLIRDYRLPQLERDWPRSVGCRYGTIEEEEELHLNELISILHPAAIMQFLKLFGCLGTCSGTIMKHIYKGKAILYQLVTGCSNDEVPGIPSSNDQVIK